MIRRKEECTIEYREHMMDGEGTIKLTSLISGDKELNDKGLLCKRPKGNTYLISDDRWALEFYYAHKDDTPEALVHAVLTNTQMWDQDLTKVEGLEAAVVNGLKMIREKGAKAAFASCL